MATTVQDVISFIWSSSCSLQDRQRIIVALKAQQKVAALRSAHQFNPGEKVEFTSQSNGLITGVIAKVNRMTVHVLAQGGGKWRVSPQLLRKATV